MFRCSIGLNEKYGSDRVFNTPLCEQVILSLPTASDFWGPSARYSRGEREPDILVQPHSDQPRNIAHSLFSMPLPGSTGQSPDKSRISNWRIKETEISLFTPFFNIFYQLLDRLPRCDLIRSPLIYSYLSLLAFRESLRSESDSPQSATRRSPRFSSETTFSRRSTRS